MKKHLSMIPEMMEAYRVLSDDTTRAAYDRGDGVESFAWHHPSMQEYNSWESKQDTYMFAAMMIALGLMVVAVLSILICCCCR